MNDEVSEWVTKAERDFRSAKWEFGAPDEPNYDDTCFHSQQCIEKLLKALMLRLGIVPPKVHELSALATLLQPAGLEWAPPVRDLLTLSRGAVAVRYPGESANRDDASEALAICTRLREELLAEIRRADA